MQLQTKSLQLAVGKSSAQFHLFFFFFWLPWQHFVQIGWTLGELHRTLTALSQERRNHEQSYGQFLLSQPQPRSGTVRGTRSLRAEPSSCGICLSFASSDIPIRTRKAWCLSKPQLPVCLNPVTMPVGPRGCGSAAEQCRCPACPPQTPHPHHEPLWAQQGHVLYCWLYVCA